MAAAGSLGSTSKIAALGIANTIQNMFAAALFVGMNSSLNTLCSTASGAKDYKLSLVYLRRGQVILVVLMIPVCLIMLFSENILIAIGQDKEVAHYAHIYNLFYLPAVLCYGLLDAVRRFLSSLKRVQVGTMIQITGCFLQFLNIWFFVNYLRLDIVGIALACIVTNSFMWLSIEVYVIYFLPELNQHSENDDDYRAEVDDAGRHDHYRVIRYSAI